MTTMGALTEQLEGSEALGTSTQLHHRIRKKKPYGAVGGRSKRRTASTPVKRLTRTHTYSQGEGLFATLGKYETQETAALPDHPDSGTLSPQHLESGPLAESTDAPPQDRATRLCLCRPYELSPKARLQHDPVKALCRPVLFVEAGRRLTHGPFGAPIQQA